MRNCGAGMNSTTGWSLVISQLRTPIRAALPLAARGRAGGGADDWAARHAVLRRVGGRSVGGRGVSLGRVGHRSGVRCTAPAFAPAAATGVEEGAEQDACQPPRSSGHVAVSVNRRFVHAGQTAPSATVVARPFASRWSAAGRSASQGCESIAPLAAPVKGRSGNFRKSWDVRRISDCRLSLRERGALSRSERRHSERRQTKGDNLRLTNGAPPSRPFPWRRGRRRWRRG